MPLVWKGRENPYRTTWFSLLELGPAARPGAIPAMRKKISAKLQHGQPHVMGGREVTEAEIIEAESRLLDERSRAWEVLLVHPSGNYNRKAPWSIPKGEPGDDAGLEQTARRETQEETGVTAVSAVPGEEASPNTSSCALSCAALPLT